MPRKTINVPELVKQFKVLNDNIEFIILGSKVPKLNQKYLAEIKKGKNKRALKWSLDLLRFCLGNLAKEKKNFFKGTAEAKKAMIDEFIRGDMTFKDAFRYLGAVPKWVKTLVKVGWLLEKNIDKGNKKVVEAANNIYEGLVQAIDKFAPFKQAQPKRLLTQVIKPLSEMLNMTADELIKDMGPMAKKAEKIFPDLKVKPEVVKSFMTAAKGKQIGKVKLVDVVKGEKAIVLSVSAEDVAFKKDFVVFFHPKLMLKKFNKMDKNKAGAIAEKMVSAVETLAKLLPQAKKDYRRLYGAKLITRFKLVDLDQAKDLPLLPTWNKSGETILAMVLNELKEAHGKTAKVKSKFQKGETVYYQDDNGEWQEGEVVRVQKDGILILKIGKKKVKVNPLETKVTDKPPKKKVKKKTEKKAKKKEGKKARKKAEKATEEVEGIEEELTPEEIEALKELGITIE